MRRDLGSPNPGGPASGPEGPQAPRLPEWILPIHVQRAIHLAGVRNGRVERPFWNGGFSAFCVLPDGTRVPL